MRVTRIDGTQVTIEDPFVRSDSIVGEGGRVAIANARAIEVKRFDGGKTFLAVVVGGAAAVAGVFFAWIISCGDSHRGNCPS